ncbi:MAG: hypothetical protein U0893_02315 [Chloroflexota bacterium]
MALMLAPTRPEGLQLDAPTTDLPHAITICDASGVPLSDADAVEPALDGRLTLRDVADSAALLERCFGLGDRQVTVTVDGVAVDGWLETRWEGGHRDWWVELAP